MISIIAAVAENGVIGGGNSMLWHIKEDFKRFKAITTGHPVIMGRKTYESLGRPLPNRTNIVITRNAALEIEGCKVVGSLEEALSLCAGEEEIFIIGGGEIYRQAMGVADKLYITLVHNSYEGDTRFPEIGSEWEETFRDCHERGETFEYPFEFIDYRKN